MSRTLNLVDILLTSGRHLFTMGRLQEALVPLTRPLGFRKLPGHANEQLQALLAEIYLQRQEYKSARRHLTAAIAANPLEANYHYLMGIAIVEDSDADQGRAEASFARAVDYDPDRAAYWVDYASHLFSIGKPKDGLKAIRRAYALDITDADVIGEVAAILRREGYADEATTKLRSALFQNHGDQRFRQLWQTHQYELIFIEQEAARKKPETKRGKPILLPFKPAKASGKYLKLGGKTIRIDKAESLPEPKEKTPVPHQRPQKG